MERRYILGALTRISDLDTVPFTVRHLARDNWATGDYVVGEVLSAHRQPDAIELTTGRMARVMPGDWVVGAFGVRRATLEAVGDWQSIQKDNLMEDMTNAGFFGRITSQSVLIAPQPVLRYCGHVIREGHKICMQDFVPRVEWQSYTCPTIMIIGTSMSAGKTTAARVIIHLLKEMGLRVIGTKLTGAGRYRDILSMHDAGADAIFDFVDAGLPSSVVPPEEFRQSLRQLLSTIMAQHPDVVVAEAGASPFEPYNGAVVLEEVADQVVFTVLCASDPYAVIGVSQSFGITPDIVSGITTNTTAGIQLVEKLAKVPALSLTTDESINRLRSLLKNCLAEHPLGIA
ncbi:hypothetical protein N836_02685 [Leptolyngbya sp. Heron Island J]|uniref:hypothetical protein n=1 Tax=Leptolyngbya sp. Heron Island J TaxID=1385935 RepID=UPI0003B9671D|nr:hypothetical protein [Leptolyngbya sp. Heron Island J]ESA37435.1 hypothetical protein N836_02685 [Leptolyngbya sp. Heron Island J]